MDQKGPKWGRKKRFFGHYGRKNGRIVKNPKEKPAQSYLTSNDTSFVAIWSVVGENTSAGQTHTQTNLILLIYTRLGSSTRRSGLAPSEPSPKVTEGLTPFNPSVSMLLHDIWTVFMVFRSGAYLRPSAFDPWFWANCQFSNGFLRRKINSV